MELKEQIVAELEGLKASLTTTLTEKAKAEVAEQLKGINDKVNSIAGLPEGFTGEELKQMQKDIADTVKGFNDFQLAQKSVNNPAELKSFEQVYAEEVKSIFNDPAKKADFEKAMKNRGKYSIDLKAVGNMTLSGNLTGDSVSSYSNRQGLVPSQRINFRDLIATTVSPTGIYVHYRETGTEGSISAQTEGSSKTQIDYDLTEVKTTLEYIAGYARVSKQMMYSLPFIQGTLPRLLLRDFYKRENAIFYAAVASGATGTAVTTKTVDVEQVVEWISHQLSADFTPSFALVHPTDWMNLLLTKPADYSVPGGVVIDANGNIRICGVPIILSSFATVDKFMLIDTDFIERVEGESLRVEFSTEDGDNFTKNLVTARVECYEKLNLIRTDAHIYGDFGNVA